MVVFPQTFKYSEGYEDTRNPCLKDLSTRHGRKGTVLMDRAKRLGPAGPPTAWERSFEAHGQALGVLGAGALLTAAECALGSTCWTCGATCRADARRLRMAACSARSCTAPCQRADRTHGDTLYAETASGYMLLLFRLVSRIQLTMGTILPRGLHDGCSRNKKNDISCLKNREQGLVTAKVGAAQGPLVGEWRSTCCGCEQGVLFSLGNEF